MVVNGGACTSAATSTSVAGVGIPATPRRAVAAVGADGALRPGRRHSMAPPASRCCARCCSFGNTIYMGGGFSAVNGQFRLGFAAVDAVSHVLVQPEMFVLGDTRIRGLDTDGARVFVAGESFGAPFIGASSIPGLGARAVPGAGRRGADQRGVRGRAAVRRTSSTTRVWQATARTTRWDKVVAGPAELLHLVARDGTVEYYTALPGTPPGAPVLASTVVGNVVTLSWTPDPAGGAPSSYNLLAGSAPGAANLASFIVRGAASLTTPAPDGTYYVRVIPRNGFGPGPAVERSARAGGPAPVHGAAREPGPAHVHHRRLGRQLRVGRLAYGRELRARSRAVDRHIESGESPPRQRDVVCRDRAVGRLLRARARGERVRRERAVERSGGHPGRQRGAAACADRARGDRDGQRRHDSMDAANERRHASGVSVRGGLPLGRANAAVMSTAVPGFSAAGVPAATYYVRVRALNAAGASPATADLVVTVP